MLLIAHCLIGCASTGACARLQDRIQETRRRLFAGAAVCHSERSVFHGRYCLQVERRTHRAVSSKPPLCRWLHLSRPAAASFLPARERPSNVHTCASVPCSTGHCLDSLFCRTFAPDDRCQPAWTKLVQFRPNRRPYPGRVGVRAGVVQRWSKLRL